MPEPSDPKTDQEPAAPPVGSELESTQIGDSVEMLDSLGGFLPSMPAKAPNLPSQTDVTALNAGDVVDDFQVLKVLGKGSFGSVYLARQISLGRMVAIKITPNKGGSEGKTMAPLEHPHIVQVFSESVRREGRERLLCMQYVPGATLAKALQRLRDNVGLTHWTGRDILEQVDGESQGAAALEPAALRDRQALGDCDFVGAICTVGEQLADALDFAHQKGVLHRDIKPANILVSQYGRTLLVDFNLSFREMDADDQTNLFGGTLSYMSPEHLGAFNPTDDTPQDAVDERSDLFSLGVVLFQMRTGTLPFGSPGDRNNMERLTLLQSLADDLTAGPKLVKPFSEADRALLKTIHRCLEHEPQDRFQTTGELAETLRGVRNLEAMEGKLNEHRPRLWSAASPVFWVSLLILIPQLLASVINVTYNMTLLPLEEAEYDKFNMYVGIYNVIIWGVCVPWVYFLIKPLSAIGTRNVTDEPALRSHLLSLPNKAALVACVGWFSGIVFFPVAMHIGAGRGDLYGHFAVNLLISGLIAIAYSALGTQYYALRMLYPCLWTNAKDVEQLTKKELSVLPARVRFLQLFSGMIPLAGALLMVAMAIFDVGDRQHQTQYLILIGILIALGMAGLQVATSVCQRITRATNAFVANQ